jgi:flagellar capping protein FliD
MQPYSQLMQMNGGPQNILPGLLQTGAALQTGNEVERARTVASLISQFQVNPAQVAGFLKGENPEPSQNEQMQQMINKQMAPVHQQLQHYQQRDQQMRQQGQEQIKGKIREFAQANEFYGDLSETMADIMDIAARNGREMGLQEAYDAAAWQHPEIRKVMLARQSQGQVQQRKRAASSIHGTPGGEGSSAAPADLRSTLEQAFQTANRM